MYMKERALAEEHVTDLRAQAEKSRRAFLVRCCSGVAQYFIGLKHRIGNRAGQR